jgi:hypothetical protein
VYSLIPRPLCPWRYFSQYPWGGKLVANSRNRTTVTRSFGSWSRHHTAGVSPASHLLTLTRLLTLNTIGSLNEREVMLIAYRIYRKGHEKVARLPFAFAFRYCINFCIYATLRTRDTFSWPILYFNSISVTCFLVSGKQQ